MGTKSQWRDVLASGTATHNIPGRINGHAQPDFMHHFDDQRPSANVFFTVCQPGGPGFTHKLNSAIKAGTIYLRFRGRRADWGHKYATLLQTGRILSR